MQSTEWLWVSASIICVRFRKGARVYVHHSLDMGLAGLTFGFVCLNSWLVHLKSWLVSLNSGLVHPNSWLVWLISWLVFLNSRLVFLITDLFISMPELFFLKSWHYWWLSNSSIFSEHVSCFFQVSPLKPDMEQKLRSAASVDELMSLIYPSYWATLKCRSKLSAAAASSASRLSQSPQPHRLRPQADTEEQTFAAAYLNLDVLKSMFPLGFNLIFSCSFFFEISVFPLGWSCSSGGECSPVCKGKVQSAPCREVSMYLPALEGLFRLKGIFHCKFNPWSNTPWNCVRLPFERSS